MRIILFFIIGATVFAIGESVTCYECLEMDSNKTIPGSLFKKCEQPFSSSDNNRKCNGTYYCSKLISSFDGISFAVRGCLNPNVTLDPNNLPDFPNPIELPSPGSQKIRVYLCKTDLCNSASLPTTTVSFLILFLLTLFLV